MSSAVTGPRRYSSRDRRRGFSLGELLIVMAIIAILSAIAYPAYMQYKVRANRAAAQSLLMELSNRQQQYFLDARSYTTSLANLGYATIPTEVSSYYTVNAPTVDNGATPPNYSLTATPISGTIQASDGVLTLTSAGAKTRGSVPW